MFITNYKIEDNQVWLFDYTRKGKKYDLDEISKIVESRLFMGKKTEKILYKQELQSLNTIDKQTLKAIKNDMEQWTNKVFKVEIDNTNNKIKVLSKRKNTIGNGFSIPLYKELLNLSTQELEKFIYNKYTTSIYKYC